MGVQCLRYILAKVVRSFRRFWFNFNENKETLLLREQGFLVVPDFLESSAYVDILEEFEGCSQSGDPTPILDGSTYVDRYTFDQTRRHLVPNIVRHICSSERLKSLVESGELRTFDYDDIWIDIIKHGNELNAMDSQKEIHTDNFYDTHKVWYFPDSVTLKNGPLMICPESHRFSVRRIIFEYIRSVTYKTQIHLA